MKDNKSANVDFIDGQMVDFDSMSIEQLKAMREKLKKREKELLAKINEQLKDDEDLDI